MTNTIPQELAKEYIVNHNYDYTTLNKNYGGGITSEQMNFGYNFLSECNYEVINELKKSASPEKDFKNIIKHLAQALLAFNLSELAYGVDHFRVQFVKNFPELSENSNLKPEFKKALIEAVRENENSSPSKETVLINQTELESKISRPVLK